MIGIGRIVSVAGKTSIKIGRAGVRMPGAFVALYHNDLAHRPVSVPTVPNVWQNAPKSLPISTEYPSIPVPARAKCAPPAADFARKMLSSRRAYNCGD